MLTYKQWRTLNENVGSALPLGVSSPQAIGVMGSNSARWEMELEEAKKKMKKKMLGDAPDDEEDVDADTGPDGEVVSKDDAAPKDEPTDDADAEADAEGDHEEPEGDEVEAGGGDEEEDDEEAPPPMLQKKKMKKCGGKKCNKTMKKEDVEEDDFMASLNRQLHFDPAQKWWDGFSAEFSEDALYQPADPNSSFYDDAAPGAVGYAPDTRIGLGADDGQNEAVQELLSDDTISEEVKEKIKAKLGK